MNGELSDAQIDGMTEVTTLFSQGTADNANPSRKNKMAGNYSMNKKDKKLLKTEADRELVQDAAMIELADAMEEDWGGMNED